MNDDFKTIIKGIEYGRMLFRNMQKVIAYLLPAGSFSELLPVLANVYLGMPLPMSSFQMIVICVLTDLCGTIALVYEKPETDLMLQKPRDPKTERLVSWRLFLYAFLQVGVIESFAAFFVFFYSMGRRGIRPADLVFAFDDWASDSFVGGRYTVAEQLDILYEAQTGYFVSLVMTQLWNLMAVRTRLASVFRHPFRWGVLKYIFGEILIVLVVVYVPVFASAFNM
jgi:sodium/potassium-transporting ATPase subunit alpha